jgi:hypothetical protein
MATAKAGPRKTTRTVTLKLTEGEGDFLLGLLALTGGHPSRSPNKYGVRITRALEGALGYDYAFTDSFELALGGIDFLPYDGPRVTDLARLLDDFGSGHTVADVVFIG